jgi:hypothetical protein
VEAPIIMSRDRSSVRTETVGGRLWAVRPFSGMTGLRVLADLGSTARFSP